MDAVMRYQVADYLNTAKSGTESFALMGVGFNTLDESPMAYKSMDSILAQIGPSVDVVCRIVPVYNFKASE